MHWDCPKGRIGSLVPHHNENVSFVIPSCAIRTIIWQSPQFRHNVTENMSYVPATLPGGRAAIPCPRSSLPRTERPRGGSGGRASPGESSAFREGPKRRPEGGDEWEPKILIRNQIGPMSQDSPDAPQKGFVPNPRSTETLLDLGALPKTVRQERTHAQREAQTNTKAKRETN